MGELVRSLAIESWTLYAVGLVLIVCRLASRRIKLGGFKNLQIEDGLMGVAAIGYTGVIICANSVAKNGSNYLAPEVAENLTPDEASMAVYGSKMTLVLEICILTTTWLVKACLLFLYYRLTKEAFHKQKVAVKLIAAYCFMSYILVVVLFLFYWCRPIDEYWRVPVRHSQCATYYQHMIFATAFNVSSDLMLLLIPLPLIIRMHLPLRRRVVLCCILGLGVFNIIAAVLNRYFNFHNPNTLSYLYWYIVEAATAVFVGNIPLCWPLIRRVFRADSWFESSKNQISPLAILPERPQRRAKPSTSLWTVTWGGSAWDKDEEEILTRTRCGRGDGSSGDGGEILGGAGVDGSQGSEIELTPGWHQSANTVGVSTRAADERAWGAGASCSTSAAENSSGGQGRDRGANHGGVMVVKDIKVIRD